MSLLRFHGPRPGLPVSRREVDRCARTRRGCARPVRRPLHGLSPYDTEAILRWAPQGQLFTLGAYA